MPLIVLWDVDHTLIENAGVSKEIYAAAFTTLSGQPPHSPAPTEGRTDRAIIRDMFHQHGLPGPPWDKAKQALEDAGRGRKPDLRRRGHILPGVREALTAVSAQPWICSSVLTGNIHTNARIKLGAFGLDSLLDMNVGAYGEDAEDRAHLVDVARTRVHTAHGLPHATPVVLIGDTPRDVQAATRGNAHIIGIASGIHTAQQLHDAGAPVVLPDLSDIDQLMERLKAYATS